MNLSRRQFFKVSAGATAVTMVNGCLASAAPLAESDPRGETSGKEDWFQSEGSSPRGRSASKQNELT